MGLLDDYQNVGEISDEESGAIDPATSRRKRSDLERQIVILDSDFKKVSREIEDMEAQKRRFKKQEERLRIDEDALDKDIKKLYGDRMSLEEEIGRLKKKLKILV